MNRFFARRPLRGLTACGIATALLGLSLLTAKAYDIACDTTGLHAESTDCHPGCTNDRAAMTPSRRSDATVG